MSIKILPSAINGNIIAPTSKSAMQRVCALALLHPGETLIKNPGKSNDDLAAINIAGELGASLELINGDLLITGNGGLINGNSIFCGESGLSIRMFTPIAAISADEIQIDGEGSLLTRPMHFFDEVLPQLGIKIGSNKGYLPLLVKGPLIPSAITIDGSLSSQFLTGLLISFARTVTSPTIIKVNGLASKPYIDLTLQMMNHFGYEVENKNYEQFIVAPVNAADQKSKIEYTVEGDWSSASFLLVAGAIAGAVSLKGLDIHSTQADKAILQALTVAEVRTSISYDEIRVESSPGAFKGKAFHFDATDCPDLFPSLVALAANCSGTSVIEGADRLIHKESNRAETLRSEFGKMGVTVKIQDNLMVIDGKSGINGAIVDSHHDHRIAMACTIAALSASGETVLQNAEAVKKSYPDFYFDMKRAGADITDIR